LFIVIICLLISIFMISLYWPYASFTPYMLDCTKYHNGMILIMLPG
jgi:hypothetical protein